MPTPTQYYNAADNLMYLTGGSNPDARINAWYELNSIQNQRLIETMNLWDDVSGFTALNAVDNTDLAARSTTLVTVTETFLGIPYNSYTYWQNNLSMDWTRVAVGDIAGPQILGINKSYGSNYRYREVYIDTSLEGVTTFELGSAANITLLHEMGHSIVGDHISGDITQTVLNAYGSNNGSIWYASTPMSLDIDAIVALYGASTTTRTGNDTYGFNASFSGSYRAAFDFSVNKRPLVTIFDNGGFDTLDASGFVNSFGGARSVYVDLNPGGKSFMLDGARQTFAVIYRSADIEAARGGDGDDILQGNNLDNSLAGGGGVDTMLGAGGNDTYYVDDANDVVTEYANQGNDWVNATCASFTLGANVESLDYTGLSTIDFSGTGNDLDNIVRGWNGNDDLDGGAGADVLTGFAGNDTYLIDNGGDSVVEVMGDGHDTVRTTISYKLANGQEIEVLQVADLADTGKMTLVGNAFAQTITGNAGRNKLDGRGGADTLIGGDGDDTYYVDLASDTVLEAGNEGVDTVYASVSYKLTAGQEIESFSTTSVTGTDAIKLVGNEFGQLIYGNDGANTLDGRGGADTMRGYKGADTYVVDDARDAVVEAAGGGSDRVLTSVTYTLAGGQEIETLSIADTSGTAGLKLTGNAFGQAINGNNGANLIDGKEGADLLRGFAGKDFFAFTTALGAGNVDRILDFSSADDTIRLENAIFTALTTAGPLSSSAFKEIGVPGAVVDDTDRILYNSSTGALSYDADGNGSTAAILFARLDNAPTLTFQDFSVA